MIAELLWTNPSTGPTHRSCKPLQKSFELGRMRKAAETLALYLFCAFRLTKMWCTGWRGFAACLIDLGYIVK